jgi:DNA-binding PadR family transcriptional regulator
MDPQKFLPLSEATFYVLLALQQPSHGYAVMQQAEALSGGVVKIGPGTLYGAFATLEKQGLITLLEASDRRKVYQLSDLGREVVQSQIGRLELMLKAAHMSEQGVAA